MRTRTLLWTAHMLALAVAALAVSSCSKKLQHLTVTNLLPVVRITSAPIDSSAVCDPDPVRSCYSLIIDWVGYDPDGRVDHYLYAIDPPSEPSADTTWFTSSRNEERLLFRSSQEVPFGQNEIPKARDYHVFVLKAVDNDGAAGPSVARAFFSFTEAPNVIITNPLPSGIQTPLLTPSVRISWSGTDDDGVFHNKPVQYKYILLNASSAYSMDRAVAHPDSFRAFSAPGFAGWDSVGGDTTTVQYTNLSPNADYLFVIVAFDEAGAYSPIFSLYGNMLRFRVGFAGALGPSITAFNEFFNYTWRPGYCVCPTTETFIEVPAGKRVTFNWFADPPVGADIRSYRWVMDSQSLTDETPRTDEVSDLTHWSARSLNNTSVTLGPFVGSVPPDPPEEHRFYIEAEDNVGFRSLGIIRFQVVPFNPGPNRMLVVKDTRLKPESYSRVTNCVANNPPTPWPTQAELDTFLFARGNTPWKCYPAGSITPPGIFAGYGFDTLGTRVQKRDLTVRLSKLSTYEFVVWMVDAIGANFEEDGTSFTEPMTALRYMSVTGKFNTLGAYVKQGGKVWLLGGGGGFASNKPWDDFGNNVPTITFSSTKPRELGPGRFMYDLARWQSEYRCSSEPALVKRFMGRFENNPATSGPSAYTQYANELPQFLELKTPATDPMPPNRDLPPRNPGRFYPQVVALEYLQFENVILENTSENPEIITEESTLDTLYRASGGGMPQPSSNPHNVVMTYYHGPTVPHGFIFSGFDIWTWRRTQCRQFVEFVLRRMLGVQPTVSSARATAYESASPAPAARPEGIRKATPGIRGRMDALRKAWFTKKPLPAPSGPGN